jgi:DNA topoisomerase-1
VGKHEDKPVEIFDGKYGMYVKWDKINATLPKELKPEEITLEQAVTLIKARAEQVGDKKPKRGAKKK